MAEVEPQSSALTPPQWVTHQRELEADERLDALRAPLWDLVNKWEADNCWQQQCAAELRALLEGGFGE